MDMKIFFWTFLEELVHIPANWETRNFNDPLNGKGEAAL